MKPLPFKPALTVAFALSALALSTFGLTQQAAPEQVLKVAVADDVGKLNPHDYASNFIALSMVYEPLVQYGEGGKLEPALAQSWKVSNDGLSISFKLQPKVSFHDGTPFDSKAAKWNLMRWVDNKDHNWLPVTSNIASILTPDALTLVLKLKKYNYATLQEIALVRPVRFLSPKSVNAKGEFAKAIGTGPWKFEAASEGQRLSLVPFEKYWGGKKQTLSKVIFEVIPDPQTRVTALQSAQVDLIGGEYLSQVPIESLPALRGDPNINLISAEGSTSYLLQANFRRAPWTDVRVRRAINLAIDRESISKTIFYGLAKPSRGLFPANVPYVDTLSSETYNYNPESAKKLLNEAGWKPGANGMLERDGKPFAFTLLADQNVFPQSRTLAELLQGQLKTIGIDLKLEVVDSDAFYPRLKKGDFDLATNITWGSPYDPHSSLTSLFTSAADDNSSRVYTDAKLNAMVAGVLGEKSDKIRQTKYTAIWKYINEISAAIPLVSSSRVYAVRKGVSGFELASTEYEIKFDGMRIESR